MTQQFEQAKQIYLDVTEFSFAIREQISDLKASIGNLGVVEDVADVDFAINEAVKELDSARKELNALLRLSTQLVCLRWTMQATMTGNAEPVRTDYVTASPKVVDMPKIPSHKSEPEAYRKFCKSIGLSEEVVVNDLARPHWPGIVEYVELLAHEGKPIDILGGVDITQTYPVYSVTRRKGKVSLTD